MTVEEQELFDEIYENIQPKPKLKTNPNPKQRHHLLPPKGVHRPHKHNTHNLLIKANLQNHMQRQGYKYHHPK